MAMRAMSEAPAGASVDEEIQDVLYSPTGSATTGYSGGSSLGLPYKGVWCTPPRVFVDNQVSFPFLKHSTVLFHRMSYNLVRKVLVAIVGL